MAAKTKIIVHRKSSAAKINRSVGVTQAQAATAARAVARARSGRVQNGSIVKGTSGRRSR